ncbi:MAG TPA: amidase family protein [Opitutaceae bacterium]|jgi:amidase/aspartyl-tRNA(Asn)/glutamyl-tRNA(Gln) amidotransferase subunit A|nr:amidase family protein [Opitutaceae bacterium]
MSAPFPVPRLDFAAWQALAPAAAAGELIARVEALPEAVRRPALPSLPPREELERRFAAAPARAPLRGVPVLVKDLFDLAGEPTRAGSTFLPEVQPARAHPEDGAFCRDLRAAGAVLAGKTHMVEFAYGLGGQNAHTGDCVHPLHPDRVSGGSSSGSAVAVAAGLVPFAAASDTGGSVRLPAAFCGIYGLRLSPYQSWIADAVPLAPPCDTAGWFTATAVDMHAAMDALLPSAGLPPVPKPRQGRAEAGPTRGCFLAMPGLDRDVARACKAAAAQLAPPPERKWRTALLESFAKAEAAYTVITSLAAWEVHRPWFEAYRERYGPATRQLVERGRNWTPEQVAAARAARDRIMRTWAEFFRDYDYLVLPAAPCVAPRRTEFTAEHRRRILELTTPASLGGLPVLTLPLPVGRGEGALSAGLQVVVENAQAPVLRSLLRQWEAVLTAQGGR